MIEIKKEFLTHFSSNFKLPVLGQSESKFHFEAKELIESEKIDNSVKNFFEEKGFSSKKLTTGGLLFKKERKTVIVTVTNFSGSRPFSICVSIEFF
ncbi:MAG: hypothetical protein Athens071416_623 [Parcubacteria group bacterium Athens0714_16]|nr:MAG: hypothetical protein Athens071416_623 [Parcubacteria group bacterium Athens0714_16]